MEFTINCTRVPIPQGTTLYGIPVDEGLAPVSQGPVSDHVAPSRSSNDSDVLNSVERASLNREEAVPTKTKPNQRIISCNNYTIFSTFNTRTLGPLGRLEELWFECRITKHRYNSDTRTPLISPKTTEKIPRCWFISTCNVFRI